MYRSLHLTPLDFGETASEQWMTVFSGESDGPFDRNTELTLVLADLGLQFLGQRARSSETATPTPSPVVTTVEQFTALATELSRLPARPLGLDLGTPTAAWIGNQDWDDIVLIATGHRSWCVIHWYTTA